jgi:hypothetical protein
LSAGLQPDTFDHSAIMLSKKEEKTETKGFEPLVLLKKHNGLASQRLQPLSHISSFLKNM